MDMMWLEKMGHTLDISGPSRKKDQSLSCESLWTAPRRVSSINSSKVQWKEFPDEVRLAVLGCSWG